MALEWTMQIAYDPMLIAIFIHDSPTYWNIQETNVFAVNMA
jgi:flavin reductase (DIM6/NTAB) family NADH-FMN oxidoreductase RutF